MNSFNGARLQPRGPVSDRGPGMPPAGRGVQFQSRPPHHHQGRMVHGRGIMGRPPMMGGLGPRSHPPGNYHNGAMLHPMQRGERAPLPTTMIHRPPPPPPQMNRRHSHVPPSYHMQQLNSNFPAGAAPMPMMGRSASLPHSMPLDQQHPFPLNVNGGLPHLPIANNRVPPPPPYPVQSPYNQHAPIMQNYDAPRASGQLVTPANLQSIHDPRSRPAASLGDIVDPYHHNSHHSNIQPSAPGPVHSSSHQQTNPSDLPGLAPSKEQIRDAWTEHVAVNGIVYYHNSILQTSVYDKPEALKMKADVSATSPSTTTGNPWKQYTDATTGKNYYSNGIVTTWDKPEGFNDSQDTISELKMSEPPKKKKRSIADVIEFHNKEEAISCFKGLLLTKEIPPSAKWNDVSKICSSDPKWEACESALTTGERKQALAEYQTKRANDLRDHERKEKIRTREAFLQLLTDKVAEIKGFSPWTSSFDDVRKTLSSDDRFKLVENDSTRESLFLDFREEFKKREERRKRALKRDAQESFEAFLMDKKENGQLTFASTWNTFYSSLSEKDRKDCRFETSPFMSDSDRELYFSDAVISLQKAEDDRRKHIRSDRQRIEKAQRDAFLDDLRKLAMAGKILPSSSWRSVEPLISSLPSYSPLYDRGGEDPREIVEEFVGEWNESYKRDRAILSQIVYQASGKHISITPSTTMESFHAALLNAVDDSPAMYQQVVRILERVDPLSSARLLLDELLLDATCNDQTEATLARRGSGWRRSGDSSEDEGEIIEEGEIAE